MRAYAIIHDAFIQRRALHDESDGRKNSATFLLVELQMDATFGVAHVNSKDIALVLPFVPSE